MEGEGVDEVGWGCHGEGGGGGGVGDGAAA